MDIVSGGIDGLLLFFQQNSIEGMMRLKPYTKEVLFFFMIFDFSTTWAFYSGVVQIQLIINKIVKYGFFTFLISNLQNILSMMYDTFSGWGAIAGGQNVAFSALTPGGIFNKGFEVCGDLFDSLTMLKWNQFGVGIVTVIAIGITLYAFIKVAFEILEMQIEFAVFSTVAAALIPFGAWDKTAMLFQRCVSATFSQCVRIMVTYFMLALCNTQIQKITAMNGQKLSASETLQASLNILILCLMIARLPQIASSVLSGGPMMGGNSIGGAVSGAVSGAITGAATAVGAGAGAVKQYQERRQQGESRGGAAVHTAGQMMLNAALHNTQAGRSGMQAYDRYSSQSRRPHPDFDTKQIAQASQTGKAGSFDGTHVVSETPSYDPAPAGGKEFTDNGYILS